MELDGIIYTALTEDQDIITATGGRIKATCFEVSPEGLDNTPSPCIIITDESFRNSPTTKDDIWEADSDSVQVGVEISAESHNEVKRLRVLVRKAVASYIARMDEDDRPQLSSLSNEGIAWDWQKPCYWDRLHYACLTDNPSMNDEEED